MSGSDDRHGASARLLEEANGDNLEDELEANTGPIFTPRSHYVLSRQEITRGIANRFVHSRTYIFLYLGLASLSVTTVVLSLLEGCPGLAFYVLEIIVNSAMILEVGIRLVAFGRQFWKSPFNTADLVLTLFCALTLLVLAFADCGDTSKEEEILDTLLLVARNVLQFARLAAVMRNSGQSIFTRPKPIDLTLPHRYGPGGGYNLDIDLEDDEESIPRSLPGRSTNNVVFDAESPNRQQQQRRPAPTVRPVDVGDDTDTWASIG
ncbi:hypothetical protein FRB96_006891 [Tulasnella sp. 330]|nr:hypothetical protein FRB96_006891 [Tulasnella sp. 330]KAG8879613.1 hypothetical protein FRB97_001577 [Tulasnella sp. 331]KAG8889355.1 hypothetical protein FRB98_004639 [Tulasnella sp. 332]